MRLLDILRIGWPEIETVKIRIFDAGGLESA